jgi:uncharacterized repeat protein (TIGR03803 family)
MPGQRRFVRFRTFVSEIVALVVFAAATLSMAAGQSETILHRFNPNTTDGYDPGGGLVADGAGNLYGVTSQGGSADAGTVFELSPPASGGRAWTETTLHDFLGGTDGADPLGALVFDKQGNLYGATVYGGAGINNNSNGTVFELTPPSSSGGAWGYAVIASFDSGQVAVNPIGPLVIDVAGNVYGYSNGGNNNYVVCGGPCGNIFELQPPTEPGAAWTGSSIYNFATVGTTDGVGPNSIILGGHGVLYGTTGGGGTGYFGTFFKLTPPSDSGGTWTEKILYNFTAANPVPFGGLIAGANGTFFGTTEGPNELGTVFQLIPPSSGRGWSDSILYTFIGGNDGSTPMGVISDKSGNLYGVTINGGIKSQSCINGGCGAVFELSPPAASGSAWTETTLHTFAGENDGGNPKGPLVLRKGLLFGATSYGGTPPYGSGGIVFRLVP